MEKDNTGQAYKHLFDSDQHFSLLCDNKDGTGDFIEELECDTDTAFRAIKADKIVTLRFTEVIAS